MSIDKKTGKAIRAHLREEGQFVDVRNKGGVDVSLYRIEDEDVAKFPELAGVEYVETWKHGIELKHADGASTEVDLQRVPSPGMSCG